jgi:hypothetical protein
MKMTFASLFMIVSSQVSAGGYYSPATPPAYVYLPPPVYFVPNQPTYNPPPVNLQPIQRGYMPMPADDWNQSKVAPSPRKIDLDPSR